MERPCSRAGGAAVTGVGLKRHRYILLCHEARDDREVPLGMAAARGRGRRLGETANPLHRNGIVSEGDTVGAECQETQILTAASAADQGAAIGGTEERLAHLTPDPARLVVEL